MTGLPAENVQDYPRPPALERVPQRVEIRLGGQKIVDTSEAWRVCETHHAPTYYIPGDAIGAEITQARGRSFCEWKGVARYWSLAAGGTVAPRCAWDYPTPTKRFSALKDHFAIYAHAMDECRVGGVPVTPQPGDFYGGWVTPNLTGIVKGGPGTEGW
ncbi:DUF427 domain-containing protein [Jannaschia aquimarina]|uniref:DUF427 domain-containing protein n=1 Tax=Jannaschia aquimarina TaxID=935700 RepID=A0A0D1EEB2_9RHOB|nr:DUF427 domain-containing protein [Jannaschia aquimarina]KIT14240.1 hypothetical protein jaqu_40340 [Jannaschia aquimarina]SNS48987.1 Uncharacterized conserved protein, DUF427 family [Jannaschia aquimarina]